MAENNKPLSGPDLERLGEYTTRLRDAGNELPGVANLQTTLKLDKPEVRVTIDRERASDLGISASDLGTAQHPNPKYLWPRSQGAPTSPAGSRTGTEISVPATQPSSRILASYPNAS